MGENKIPKVRTRSLKFWLDHHKMKYISSDVNSKCSLVSNLKTSLNEWKNWCTYYSRIHSKPINIRWIGTDSHPYEKNYV